jgi:phosphotransferase system  glucose/maltose/N-acetylglucosamine-specific IIC component
MRRYVLGGMLMGVGGALGLGCSIGQGLTGMSTLAFSSMIASLCILLGAGLAAQRNR